MHYKPISKVNLKQSLFGGIETVESAYNNYVIELSNVNYSYKYKLEIIKNAFVLKLSNFNLNHS